MPTFDLIEIPRPTTTAEINALAAQLAQDHARAIITSACSWSGSDDDRWYNTRDVPRVLDADDVRTANQYLHLLEGQATDYEARWSLAFPHLVKFTDRE